MRNTLVNLSSRRCAAKCGAFLLVLCPARERDLRDVSSRDVITHLLLKHETMRDWRLGTMMTVCFVYAVVRYVIFKGVSPEHLPLYVANKAFSLVGLLAIGCAALLKTPRQRKAWGFAGLICLGLHVVISLAILNPGYFAKFYSTDGKFLWQIECALLAGAVGFVAVSSLGVATLAYQGNAGGSPGMGKSLISGLGRCVLLLSMAHVFMLGYKGWLAVSTWPGWLPPITLLAFGAAAAMLLAKWTIVRRQA